MGDKRRRSDRLKKKASLLKSSSSIISQKDNVIPFKDEQIFSLPMGDKKRRSDRLKKKTTSSIIPLKDGQMFSLPKNETVLQNDDEVINWIEWVAASNTKNYLMEDSFLDILQNKSSTVIKANPHYSKEIAKTLSLSTNTDGFIPNLLNSGKFFENKIVDLLIKELGRNNIINIEGDRNARSTQKYRETIQALHNGVPCIFQGILRNYENKTYGVADILIRSDWVNKFLDVNALSSEETNISASKLKNPEKNSRRFRKNKNVRYHYVVIDIKYKTLQLRSDGIHLRNDSNLKAYKSQLWIYNDALAKIQGYRPPYAFILGSKWKYTSSNKTFEGKSCFERLGRIDYGNLDKVYIEKTQKAVEWLNDVRTEGETWDLSKYPLPRDELYPNMCNRYDYPYHGIKKTFAETNGDLTLLWNVGPKQRRIANEKGVYNWEDPNCTPEALGINSKIRSQVLSRILEANHSETRNIYPKYVQNNFSDWKNSEGRNIELFVDFETTCSVFSEMEDLPLNTGTGLIFLIGAGYIDPNTKEWVFKKFVVNSIDESEEFRICEEFFQFTKILKKKFKIKESLPCYHWASHEPTTWKKVFERNKKKIQEIEWVDLLKVFKLEPIGIKGCLNFGLKNIAKSLHKYGNIETTWDTDGSCVDGSDAAVTAFRVNKECLKKQTSFANHSLTLDIIKYNEVDCKVLMEILHYFREHHIDPTIPEDIEDFISDLEEETKKPIKKRRIEIEDVSSVEIFE